MCEIPDTLQFEAIGLGDNWNERVQPVIDAAFKAAEDTCCGKRKGAVTRAVFKAATEARLGIAWGSVLRKDDKPDYYVWPLDRRGIAHTVAEWLEREHANRITARDLA